MTKHRCPKCGRYTVNVYCATCQYRDVVPFDCDCCEDERATETVATLAKSILAPDGKTDEIEVTLHYREEQP